MKRPASRHLLLAPCFLATALFSACQSQVVPVGTDGRAATYSLATLSTDLPPDNPVLTVAAAAERALQLRGYVITRRVNSERECLLGGEFPGQRENSRTDVYIFTLHTGVRVQITIRPFGDLAESQAMMDAILAQLGK